MTVKERIMQFLEYSGISVNKFERTAGLSVGYLRQLRKEPSREKIKSIIFAFPQINETWLLTGEGEMLKKKPLQNEVIDPTPLEEFLIRQGLANGTYQLVPLLPTSAMANPLAEYLGPGIKRTDCLDIISPVPGAEFAITISGDSMEPKFRDGMIAFLKRINEAAFIPWGNTLVLDTENGIYIKDVFPVKDNDMYIEARSANELYPPMLIPKTAIFGLYRVLSATKFYTTM